MANWAGAWSVVMASRLLDTCSVGSFDGNVTSHDNILACWYSEYPLKVYTFSNDKCA